MQVVVQKIQVKLPLLLRYVSNKRPMGDRAHPNARKAAMEMCAICRGKLGLDAVMGPPAASEG